ncbi:amidohydrolase family protein [candidate division KSB1 bacterium]|nr:amidohydrolase family protein [candidate division KSB1 bacterium]
MKQSFWTTLLVVFATTFSVHARPRAASQAMAFTHVAVIDATGSPPQPNMTVVITGNRITALGKTGRVKIPQDAQVIDAAGKFLIPGLWDMHWHSWDEKTTREIFFPLAIANGVTGVRDMAADCLQDCGEFPNLDDVKQWRNDMAQGKFFGPRLIASSPILDGPKPVNEGSISVTNATEARQTVIDLKRRGVDFIKVYSLLPRDAYFAIADEAGKQNMVFAGHVPDAVTAAEASDAGQKSIEHLTGILLACSTREAELSKELLAASPEQLQEVDDAILRNQRKRLVETYSEEKAQELFARFARNGTWQCPTLTIERYWGYFADANLTADPRLKYLPLGVKEFWESSLASRLKNNNEDDRANAKRVYQKELKIVGAMHRAGVGILAGTDVTNEFCFPGFSLHDELALLVQAGLTPMQALQAATLNPAKYLGTLDSLGTIATGKLADLVLLEANPLTDIGNTQSIAAVVVNGKFFPKTALQEMLANVEKATRNR